MVRRLQAGIIAIITVAVALTHLAAIQQIRAYGSKLDTTYNETFLRDHTEEIFFRSFLTNCSEQILNVFGMRSALRAS